MLSSGINDGRGFAAIAATVAAGRFSTGDIVGSNVVVTGVDSSPAAWPVPCRVDIRVI